MYEVLDGDGDGEPPEICGGRDCNDVDPLSGIGSEQCDGFDNDCDSRIDEGGSGCGEGQRCVDGFCECDGSETRNCAGTCVDISSDVEHCGGCYLYCEGSCVGGACQCAAGLTNCFGACVDTENDPVNCGGCRQLCGSGTCTGGVCQSCGRAGDPCCPGSSCDSGATCEAGTCVACGSLGDACCTGATCATGMCVRDVCSDVRCDEPYPAIPSGGLPRCSAATWTCVEGCTTSTCLTSCLSSDTTPEYMGIDCQTCVSHQIIYCGDRSGCSAERQAWECCLETNCPPGSGVTCPDMCNPQFDAFIACLDTRAPTCRDVGSTYPRMCFP